LKLISTSPVLIAFGRTDEPQDFVTPVEKVNSQLIYGTEDRQLLRGPLLFVAFGRRRRSLIEDVEPVDRDIFLEYIQTAERCIEDE